MKYIIGMDVGTTATKGVLYDEKGKAVFSASKGYPLIQTKIGQAEEDPKMIFDAVQEIIFAFYLLTTKVYKLVPSGALASLFFDKSFAPNHFFSHPGQYSSHNYLPT